MADVVCAIPDDAVAAVGFCQKSFEFWLSCQDADTIGRWLGAVDIVDVPEFEAVVAVVDASDLSLSQTGIFFKNKSLRGVGVVLEISKAPDLLS